MYDIKRDIIQLIDNGIEFVEEKSAIKDRMKSQWVASRKGVSENQVYGMGKIKLANYFVTIEIYDFSVSEDEVLSKEIFLKIFAADFSVILSSSLRN